MNEFTILQEPHPFLDAAVFILHHDQSASTDGDPIGTLLAADHFRQAETPFNLHRDPAEFDRTKSAVRDMLRQNGYKPTGRGKPASEYLVRAVGEGKLGRINPIVDTLNAVSLHSGLPISVVDLEKCSASKDKLKIGVAQPDSEYVFNASGQTMRLGGLLCLYDDDGPCANAVKDSQRTKTSDQTKRSLIVIWGTNQLPDRTRSTQDWFCELIDAQHLGDVVAAQLAIK